MDECFFFCEHVPWSKGQNLSVQANIMTQCLIPNRRSSIWIFNWPKCPIFEQNFDIKIFANIGSQTLNQCNYVLWKRKMLSQQLTQYFTSGLVQQSFGQKTIMYTQDFTANIIDLLLIINWHSRDIVIWLLGAFQKVVLRWGRFSVFSPINIFIHGPE